MCIAQKSCFKLTIFALFRSGWIETSSLLDYSEHRDFFVKKYKLTGIKKAVTEVDEYLESSHVSNFNLRSIFRAHTVI